MNGPSTGQRPSLFAALRNPIFLRLYLAQAVSLFGDAFTWLGLALVSYQFGPERSAAILASALTLRVTAYILVSPFAGVIADRFHRKRLLCLSHFARVAIVAAFPFVTSDWQMYPLVFVLNIFNGIFTPTYRAVVPAVVTGEEYRPAIGLSNATYQLLGIAGPGVAGIFAAFLGAREIFFVDAVSFLLAGLLLISLPGDLGSAPRPTRGSASPNSAAQIAREVVRGMRLLFGHPYLRFSMAAEFISALAGAQILVNSIAHVKAVLHGNDQQYGWAMSAFALGAALAALLSSYDRSPTRRVSLIVGSLLLGLSVMLADQVDYFGFVLLWSVAGLGQSLADIPSETLIGENIALPDQGKVYGAHFAVSHLWWAIAYPIAGWLGTVRPREVFALSGPCVLVLAIALGLLSTWQSRSANPKEG